MSYDGLMPVPPLASVTLIVATIPNGRAALLVINLSYRYQRVAILID